MPAPVSTITIAVAIALVCFGTFSPQTLSQTQPRAQDQTDVVRVYTDLVQTDVMVFDKEGRFKDDLRKEDFELRIDGKLKPIEFFERVMAGSVSEESQLAAARRSAPPSNSARLPGAVPLDRGRTVLFYVDDFHLDVSGAQATRKAINSFIDGEMGQNDEAAITSASGQIGFLQQITDNKRVLRAALERLNPRPYSVTDMQRPIMTEYHALQIDNLDRDVTEFFIEAFLRENPGLSREIAENNIKGRSNQILQQSASVTRNSLIGLESLVRSSTKLPGRKLLFFISNGFFVNHRNSDARDRLQRITSAAARSGVVIYSMDSRGLVASFLDASTATTFDPSGRLERSSSGELLASQDGLNALARDTGGRAIFNTNDLKPGLKNALKETSVYYLLAWKPEQGTESSRKFRRIEVKLVGKPDFTVRVRRGFFDVEPQPIAADSGKDRKPAEKKPEPKLWEVIGAPLPERDIPFSLSLIYTNTPDKGGLLSATMQIPREFLTFSPADGKSKAVVELAGAIYNEKGQTGARFNERMTVTASATGATTARARNIVYTFPVYLGPGLYQARVGMRDVTSGKAGSAHKWIEIPDLSAGQVALSSLHLGERDPTIVPASASAANPAGEVDLSIDHRFRGGSYLRFLVFVYNAARASDSKPDVALQVQLTRDNQPVITTPLRKVDTEGFPDLNRLPYAAEVSLANLSSGRYLLRVTVVDRVSKRSASQETHIEIE